MYTEQNAILVSYGTKNPRRQKTDAGRLRLHKETKRQPRLTREVVFLVDPQLHRPPELLRQSKPLLASRHSRARSSPSLTNDAQAHFPAPIGWFGCLRLLHFLLCCSLLTLFLSLQLSCLSWRQLEGWQAAAMCSTKGMRAAQRDLTWALHVAWRHHDLSGAADHSCHEPDARALPQTCIFLLLRQGTTRYACFGAWSVLTPRPAYLIKANLPLTKPTPR